MRSKLALLRQKFKVEDAQLRSWKLRKLKPVILIGCFVLSLLMLLGSTLAWFTANDEVLNRVHRDEPAKRFEVLEVDVFPDEQDLDGEIEKRVGAQNVGDLPAFVRLLVLPVFKSEEGHLMPAVLGRPGENPGDPPVPEDANVIVKDFNLAAWNPSTTDWEGGDWADGGDGYYYYLNRLDPETSTDALGTNLFETLELVRPMPPGYENATLVIEVKSEAVELKNYREAWWGLIGNAAPAALDVIIQRIDGKLLSETP